VKAFSHVVASGFDQNLAKLFDHAVPGVNSDAKIAIDISVTIFTLLPFPKELFWINSDIASRIGRLLLSCFMCSERLVDLR